jgi:hypothetical protein
MSYDSFFMVVIQKNGGWSGGDRVVIGLWSHNKDYFLPEHYTITIASLPYHKKLNLIRIFLNLYIIILF